MSARQVWLGVATVVWLLGGCRREEAQPGEAVPPGEIPPATQSSELPQSIEQAESLSEDVQDLINAGDWNGAQRVARQLETLAVDLRGTQASPDEVAMYDSAVAVLSSNVQTRQRLPADTAANRVSRAAVTMMANYSPAVPVAVGYMDVAARDAMYRAELAQWHGVEYAIAELDLNYTAVADHVRNANTQLDDQVRSQLEALRRAAQAQDVPQVKQAAGQILDEVDKIETSY